MSYFINMGVTHSRKIPWRRSSWLITKQPKFSIILQSIPQLSNYQQQKQQQNNEAICNLILVASTSAFYSIAIVLLSTIEIWMVAKRT